MLLALAFLSPTENDSHKYVIHKNGDISDNSLDNLKWSQVPEESDDDCVEWVPYPEDKEYFIKNTGEIKSYKSGVGKILKPYKTERGYSFVNLKGKLSSVHRIMIKTFKPDTLTKETPIVDHINRNPSDNSLKNLRAVSHRENAQNRSFKKGKQKKHILKFTEKGEFLKEYNSAEEVISDMKLVLTPQTIQKWARDEKINKGFLWKYKKDIYIPKDNEKSVRLVGKFDEYTICYPDHILYSSGVIVNAINNFVYKISYSKGCYPNITLYKDKKTKKFSIHRLLCLFFKEGRTKEKNIVNHIDENKNNFDLDNLEWCTTYENIIHSLGKSVNKIDPKTKKILKTYTSCSEAGKDLEPKKRKTNIGKVCNGVKKTACGFLWEWVD